jgi:hypothetical protein
MISYNGVLASEPFKTAWMLVLGEKPVYARLPDGRLCEIDAVVEGQIMTSMGPHDVIVMEVSEKESAEA